MLHVMIRELAIVCKANVVRTVFILIIFFVIFLMLCRFYTKMCS